MRSDLIGRRGHRGRGEEPDETGELFGMASESEARHVLRPTWQSGRGEKAAAALPLVQGAYYLTTGLWPLVHMESFERVTGRKTDRWLVRTVGVLVGAIGWGLLQSGRRGYLSKDMRSVSQLAAAGIIAVEVPTALRGRISPIYLADAIVELGLLAAHRLAADSGSYTGRELDALVRREAEDALE